MDSHVVFHRTKRARKFSRFHCLRRERTRAHHAGVPEAPPPSRGRLSLVGFLGALLFFELWLNRIAARLVRLDAGRRLEPTWRRLDTLAFFLFELASVLGAMLFVGAIARVVSSRTHRPPLRMSVALVGGVTATLVAGGSIVRLPPRLMPHLYLSAIFLLLVIVLGALAQPTSRRVRAGLAMLAVPVGLMLVANLLQRLSAPGVLDPRASLLAESAGAVLVTIGIFSPWLLGPEGPGGPAAVAAGAITAGAGIGLGHAAWDVAARLAGIGLGVAIPVGPVALPIYVLGASAIVYTTVALLMRPGPDRLRGVGLFLIGAVGLQLELPYQIAGSLLGFFCLLDSGARPAPGAMDRAEFDGELRRLAAVLGAAQVTVTGPSGRERARLGFEAAGGVPGQLSIDRRAGAITRVELNLGEQPERTPPFTLCTRGARGLGPLAPGPAIATDDASFDRRFVVRDHRGAGTALLDAETRARMLRLIDGWLGVWPQRGARYVARGLPTEEGPSALVELLGELRARAGGA
jgi:hypothetical protein